MRTVIVTGDGLAIQDVVDGARASPRRTRSRVPGRMEASR